MTYIAFDIDGTLFDCSDIIADAFQKGIRQFREKSSKNITIPSKSKIMTVIGIPTDSIFKNLFPELDDIDLHKINDFCTYSLIELINKGGGQLFDNVYTILNNLNKNNYTLLIASNGRLEYIEAIINSKVIVQFFSKPIIVVDNNIKNKTDIISYYKKNISKNNLLIMIGDRESDRVAAKDNNIPFIGCAYGHAGDKEIKGSTWIVNRFNEIPLIIKKIEKEFELK